MRRRLLHAALRASAPAATISISTAAALCDSRHNDKEWYEAQHAHQQLGLSLCEEAALGVWNEVTRRYRLGESVNASADREGRTVLHHAAMAGKRLIVEELVAHGAESKPDRLGRTPLHSAALAGHASVATTLIALGAAEANEQDASGWTALHHAAQYGHLQVTRALLDEPTLEPSRRDAYGVTPLHKAVSFGHAAVVAALVADRRVEVDRPIGTPTVPEAYAAQTGRETALHLAASHTYHFNHTRHTRIARLLLDGGADPNARCGEGLTAAHRAARAGNLGVLRELRACGGRVDWGALDPRGRTPTELARLHGHDEAAELLERPSSKRPSRRRSSSGK